MRALVRSPLRRARAALAGTWLACATAAFAQAPPPADSVAARAVVEGGFEAGLAAYDAGRFEAAFALWLPLAEQGRAAAQFNLGTLYENGQGVARDLAQAAHWTLKAAEQGDVDAQLKIAAWYASGTGVARDVAKARYWFGVVAATPGANRAAAARQAREQLAKLPRDASAPQQEVIAFDDGRYVISRAASNDCVVSLQGIVNRSASYWLDEAMKRAAALGCVKPLTLMLESPGGLVEDGLRLGRQVRAEGMRTVARYECASSCATIFLGGVQRVLWGARAAIGLHQAALIGVQESDRRCSQSRDDPPVVAMRNYLRFAVPADADRIFQIFMATPCHSIEWITGQRAHELGIATQLEAEGVDVFGPKAKR